MIIIKLLGLKFLLAAIFSSILDYPYKRASIFTSLVLSMLFFPLAPLAGLVGIIMLNGALDKAGENHWSRRLIARINAWIAVIRDPFTDFIEENFNRLDDGSSLKKFLLSLGRALKKLDGFILTWMDR